MKRRPVPQRQLPGFAPVAKPQDQTPVELPLQLIDQTDVAWLLRPALKGAEAKWAPKSKVVRLEGARAGLFRMPHWVAADRGWLR